MITRRRPLVRGITIDGPTSMDLDDAVWLDGHDILVSIADVASAVPIGSPVDREARSRAFTRYFASGNRPMLPRAVAEGSLSLLPGRVKAAVTTRISLDEGFEIADVRVERTRLEPVRFDYAGVDAAISGREPSEHAPMLARCRDIALLLLRRRRDRGALAFYDLARGWRTTEDGLIVQVGPDQSHVANVIVQEFMILANAAMARWVAGQGASMLFRNHEAPPADPIRDSFLATIQAALDDHDMALIAGLRDIQHRTSRRAVYSPENAGHHGLNLLAYCHSTSPIRRYADLVVQRIASAIIEGAAPPYSADELAAIGSEITATDHAARDAKAAYLKGKAYARAEEQAMDENAIDKLDAADFGRVLKVGCVGGLVTPLVARSAQRRIGDGSLTVADMRLILLGPAAGGIGPLRRAVFDHLRRNPHDATTILASAEHEHGLGPVSYVESHSGEAHARRFRAGARVVVGGTPIVGKDVISSSKKTSRQLACVNLLARLVEEPEPEGMAADLAPVPKKSTTKPAPASDDNPVGELQERCHAMGSPTPEFSFVKEGPPHAPTITCTGRALGFEISAVGASNKEAKRLAARMLLEIIVGRDSNAV